MSSFSLDSFLEEGESPLFDFGKEKDRFLLHMEDLKKMGVEESTFWKKWIEVKEYRQQAAKSSAVKSKIWRPDDIFDKAKTISQIENLRPRIFYVEPTNEEHMTDWLMLRIFCHTMEYEQTPGRFLRFLIVDDISGQYLGAASLSNDVMALSCRDSFIGWTAENRIGTPTEGQTGMQGGMLIHSAIGSCIMGTQPFGFNFLGGKLVASLILSQHVRDTWQRVVGKKLVGMTTTSLYGPNSMYCGIPYWEGCGTSLGRIALKPDDSFYDIWHDYIKIHRKKEYQAKIEKKDPTKGPITGIKQRILDIIFREVGTSSTKYHHGFERGVYYSMFYEQSRHFLCKKTEEPIDWTLRPRFVSGDKGIIDWWRKKAVKRYISLFEQQRLKPTILFYNKMIEMNYETAKREFFSEVGR